MKKITLIILALFISFTPNISFADLKQGVKLYSEGEFRRAYKAFDWCTQLKREEAVHGLCATYAGLVVFEGGVPWFKGIEKFENALYWFEKAEKLGFLNEQQNVELVEQVRSMMQESRKVIEKDAENKKKVLADSKRLADKNKADKKKAEETSCSDIPNRKIDADVKGYKDVFFGMTKNEFKTLARCNKGSLYDIQNQGYVQDGSRKMGDNLIIFEGTDNAYPYQVNAIFSSRGVTEIIVRAYSEYHNVMRINSKSSGITGIDKIKDLLEKKYSLLIKPSDESIEKYNEYIGWNEVDFVFQNKDTQNLVILKVNYRDPDVLGLKFSYQGFIHYLSKRASETYLNNIQSEVLSEDDF